MTIYTFIDINWNQFNWLALPVLVCWMQISVNLFSVDYVSPPI